MTFNVLLDSAQPTVVATCTLHSFLINKCSNGYFDTVIREDESVHCHLLTPLQRGFSRQKTRSIERA